ncbi:MAG: hypothetical protein HZA64_14145 [Rhodocyclales bacterium]|nr:hypothetical protein [Rhodocyclales bacterium]
MAGENCTSRDTGTTDKGGEATAIESACDALLVACSQFHKLRNLALGAKALAERIDDIERSDEGLAAIYLCDLLEQQALACAAQADEALLAASQ